MKPALVVLIAAFISAAFLRAHVPTANGWSSTGLAKALIKEGKRNEAAAIIKKAKKAFSGSDMKIINSVF